MVTVNDLPCGKKTKESAKVITFRIEVTTCAEVASKTAINVRIFLTPRCKKEKCANSSSQYSEGLSIRVAMPSTSSPFARAKSAQHTVPDADWTRSKSLLSTDLLCSVYCCKLFKTAPTSKDPTVSATPTGWNVGAKS